MCMVEKIRSILVEDELAARETLKNYLGKYCPQIELVGEAVTSKEGIALIQQCKPQLVFLDVEMPYGNAFDVLEACKEETFETIFVTAFSEYSLRALNQSAAYYLLKPVSIEELVTAVNKVEEQIRHQQTFNRNQIIINNFKNQYPEKQQIIIPTLEGFEVIKIKDILRLQANGNFTDIFLYNGTKKMVCRFLKHFTEILPTPFVRVHRSHIINLEAVVSYSKSLGGYVTLCDGSEVEISASYKENFLQNFT